MIINVHNHVPTRSLRDCESACQELERRMDKAKIDVALTMTEFDTDHHPQRDTDYLIEVAQKHPRVLPIAAFDWNYRDDSLKAIESYLRDNLIVGIKCFTGYQFFHPTSPELAPLVDMAVAADVPVIFHTGATAKDYPSRLKYCCDPLQFDELAFNKPTLKIVCAHFNAPQFMQMAPVLENRPDRVYVDLSGLFTETSDERRNPYIPVLKSRLYEAMSYGEDCHQLMYGADYPYCSEKESVAFLQRFLVEYEFPSSERDNIFYKNALHFFSLERHLGGIRRKPHPA